MNQIIRKNLIPGIEGFIEHTLKQLKLKPDISPRDFVGKHQGKKHRYATSAQTADGRTIIFYARLHNNSDAKQKFLCDIAYLKKLHGTGITHQYVPRVYQASIQKNKEWFTREYITERPLGSIHEALAPLKNRDVPRFVRFFSDLQAIPILKKSHLAKRDGDFSNPIAEGNFRRVQKHFSAQERKLVKKFLRSTYHIFNVKTTHAVHGDCHPGNILYGPQHMSLIDWETVHLNLRVMDIAYLYAGLAHAPSFRRALLAAFEKRITWKKEFHELFPVGAVFYALVHLYTLSLKGRHGVSLKNKKCIQEYCSHVVKKGSEGYTTLRRS